MELETRAGGAPEGTGGAGSLGGKLRNWGVSREAEALRGIGKDSWGLRG